MNNPLVFLMVNHSQEKKSKVIMRFEGGGDASGPTTPTQRKT